MQLVDGVDGLLSAESLPSTEGLISAEGLLSGEDLVGADIVIRAEAPEVVLDEALGIIAEALALCFLVPRDNVSACGPAHLGSMDCLAPVPQVPR